MSTVGKGLDERYASSRTVGGGMVGRGVGSGSAPEYAEVGDRLRVARTARGLSLRALAQRLGVSPSLISQVERGLAKPSVNTLYAMSRELGVSLDQLLFDGRQPGQVGGVAQSHGMARESNAAAGVRPGALVVGGSGSAAAPIQRADRRKVIRLASGVVWERLTTESVPGVDFLYVTYEVGGASSRESEFQRHGGHEWGFVLSGSLGITIGFEEHELGPGDAISIDSTMPHRLVNRGSEPVHAVWFVLGRRSLDVPGLQGE
jgi:mannose-6-phosphate isomerase-like protein (cupin superfamily)/DNA-binding XRE family transcriptional regulator